MNRKILLYALIVSLLVNVFIYLYFKQNKTTTVEQTQSEEVIQQVTPNASIDSLQNIIFDISHYTLSGNDKAQEYLEQMSGSYDIKSLKEALYELNHVKTGNNFAQFTDNQHPIISRAEVLNHKWILADFDTKKISGQLLIKYTIEADGKYSFVAIDRALYLPKPQINIE